MFLLIYVSLQEHNAEVTFTLAVEQPHLNFEQLVLSSLSPIELSALKVLQSMSASQLLINPLNDNQQWQFVWLMSTLSILLQFNMGTCFGYDSGLPCLATGWWLSSLSVKSSINALELGQKSYRAGGSASAEHNCTTANTTWDYRQAPDCTGQTLNVQSGTSRNLATWQRRWRM